MVLFVELESSSQIGTDQSVLCIYISVPNLLCRGMGNVLSTHSQPLIKLQNKIIRIITNSHFMVSFEKFHTETGILPFVTLVKYRIGLVMFKIAKDTVPISISRL